MRTCACDAAAGDFGGWGVALGGFTAGMDVPPRPEMYLEALEAMRRTQGDAEEDNPGGSCFLKPSAGDSEVSRA